MKKLTILTLLVISLNAFGQSEFNKPWTDTTKAIIIDPYYANKIEWNKLVTDKRVAGIIHKASQGLYVDKKYKERKTVALKNGFLWGAYHLGKPGDPVAQADYFLNTIGNDTSVLMALDLEELNPAKFMTLKDAEKFIARVFEKTGKYPLVYCNNAVLKEIEHTYDATSVFAKCGLWYARFVDKIPDYKTKIWKTYAIWQFSCELNCTETGKCKYNVPGSDKDMDINVYNGNVADLKSKWSNLSAYVVK